MVFDDPLRQTRLKWAKRLQHLRTQSGKTAQQVADAMKMHRGTVTNLEAGEINNIETLAKCLKVYGLTLEDFLAEFYAKDLPEGDEYLQLKTVMNSGLRMQIAGLRSALAEAFNAVLLLKGAGVERAHGPPGVKRRRVSS